MQNCFSILFIYVRYSETYMPENTFNITSYLNDNSIKILLSYIYTICIHLVSIVTEKSYNFDLFLMEVLFSSLRFYNFFLSLII